ncbi:DUF421 domain-containing protein [Chitinophaga sp. RCC_12]|uniref:DUF421 domain-containing protein n=1 Tax=Chitinophaga sp. RCC_12 TaxID=3239226 RepID=UPI003526BF1D
MDKSTIRLDDLSRILLGNAPVEFMIEVLIRTIIIYIFLLFIVKWFGKRMSGQLTILELGIMIMLGAIVSPVTASPERGIAAGMFTLLLILIYQRSLTLWGIRNPRIEKLTQSTLTICVKDGVIQVDEIKRTGIPRSQLFTVLREKNIYNLGKVKRIYLEACGLFSIYQYKEDQPGLSVLPVKDAEIHTIQTLANNDIMSCTNCGNTKKISGSAEICTHCGTSHWEKATL